MATAQSRGSTEKQCHETRAPGRLTGVAGASTLRHGANLHPNPRGQVAVAFKRGQSKPGQEIVGMVEHD